MLKNNKDKKEQFLIDLKNTQPPLTAIEQAAKDKKNAQKLDTYKFLACLIAFSCVVVACIFFIVDTPIYLLIIALVGFGGLGLTIAFINHHKRESIFKLLFVALITAAILFIAYVILRRTGVLTSLEDAERIAALIRASGFWGVGIFIIFIILNTVFLPLPLAVPAVIGALVFGPLLSFVYMGIGTVLGSIIVFSLGKRFGQRLVMWMIGREKTLKYANILDKKGRLAFIFMMIFPFFPDDILCLVAGMSNMTYKFFLGVICPIRIGVLAFTSFFASGQIIPFSGWGIPVWISISVVFVGAFVIVSLIRRKRNKMHKT